MRKLWLVLSAVVVLAAVGALLLLDDHGDRRSSRHGPPAKHEEDEREQWEKLVRRGVREERAHRFGPGSTISATVGVARHMPLNALRAAQLNVRDSGVLHLRFDDARYVNTPVGVGLWVVRGRGVTCMFDAATFALACNTTPTVAKKGLLLEVYDAVSPRSQPTHFVALGITPERTKAVRAAVGSKTVKISVIDNAYGYRAEVPIKVER